MKDVRLVFLSFLICLPAALIVGVGGFFAVTEVPRAVRNEPGRIGREYREIAEGLVLHPERASYEGERKTGWQRNGKIGGTAWGYASEGATTHVWHALEGRRCRAVAVPTRHPFPYQAAFYGGGAVVTLTLFWLSALAVLYLVRYMRERDDFLAATAHDLTTPLVGLRRMIGRDDEEAKRLNERMLLIVGNIRDFLKLGGRRKSPETKPCDLVAICREAYALFAADYEDADGGPADFHFPPPPESADPDKSPIPALPVLADPTLTTQILWNLFGNDLKYAAPYGKVSVSFARNGGFASVSLDDEGPGMTPRQMRRAFDRYYRAKTVLQSGKGGFGIGLCTAREFARTMGGDLAVRANASGGCAFTLTLPLAHA